MADLKHGDIAPDFELLDQDGTQVRLSQFRGKRVLLYFYPRADTPGCTKQACSVRDSSGQLADQEIVALGISPDTPGKQRKFDDKYSLGFPLLADPDHRVSEAYGVWQDKSMYGKTYKGIVRSSFLIDGDGRISDAWYKVKPLDTVPKALEAAGA